MVVRVILLLVSTAAVMSQPVDEAMNPDDVGRIVDRASLQYLKELTNLNQNKNIITSPLGVFILVSLYGSGTSGALQNDIRRALYSDSKNTNYNQLMSVYSQLGKDLGKVNNTFFTLANKFYARTGEKFQKTFLDASKVFNTEIAQVDFSDTKKTANVINAWSKEKTRGLIEKPIKDNTIDPGTIAALFNVLYFKGTWQTPFKETLTKEGDFQTKDGTKVKKQFMKLFDSFNHRMSPKLNAQILELPYEQEGFRMIVVLPTAVNGLASVLKAASEGDVLFEEMQQLVFEKEVDLLFPKFEIESSLDLNDVLDKMGLGRLFSTSADGIVEKNSVIISKVFQEAVIKVDEKGSEAAAFTGAIMFATALVEHQTVNFHADHPFLFAILKDDTIIFMGTYEK